MKNPEYKSKCCKAPVVVRMSGDFYDGDDIGTCHYECLCCHKICDVILKKNKK